MVRRKLFDASEAISPRRMDLGRSTGLQAVAWHERFSYAMCRGKCTKVDLSCVVNINVLTPQSSAILLVVDIEC